MQINCLHLFVCLAFEYRHIYIVRHIQQPHKVTNYIVCFRFLFTTYHMHFANWLEPIGHTFVNVINILVKQILQLEVGLSATNLLSIFCQVN